MVVPKYKLVDMIVPITYLPNSNAKSLTIQNLHVSSKSLVASNTFLRHGFYSHKKHMGGDQNSLTQHGRLGDSVDIVQVICPTEHHQPTNPQYLYYHQYP